MSDDTMPRYDGPRALAESLSAFARASAPDAPGIAKACATIPNTAIWDSPPRPAAASASSTSGR